MPTADGDENSVLNQHIVESGKAAPLRGRRLYFVGIGGSGMSAYANIARALGAEVRGWDIRDTIFMGSLDGIDIDLGDEPTPPAGWEAVVSTAHLHRIDGTPRADFLAELVAAQPSIVVGGAHGKTTTSAMIAFVLRETGRDPAWIIGGIVPQLGGNAGAGAGWLVVEGDESDRSIGSLAPQIAVITNIELDHHATYASEAELRAFFDRVARDRSPGRSQLGASTRRARARRARGSQPSERRRCARRARARRGAAPRGRGCHRAFHRSRAETRARRRSRRRHGLRRLRSQSDRARGDVAHGEVARRAAG